MSVETLAPVSAELSDSEIADLWSRLMDESGVVRPVILCNNAVC